MNTAQESKKPILQQRDTASKHPPAQEEAARSARDATEANPINTVRKGMKSLSIICLVFAGVYTLIGIGMGQPAISVSLGGFLGVLAIMFGVLAKSPKESPFVLGKQAGLTKMAFVLICIVLAIFMSFVGAQMIGSASLQGENSRDQLQSPGTQTKKETASSKAIRTPGQKSTPVVSLSDVQKWYQDQLPSVIQSLLKDSNSIQGLSNMNITDSKFRFGEDSGWYDCHYTLYFTCKIDGAACTGEARAFMKYKDNQFYYFHFEISRNSDLATIVEHYDASYDAIIEEYYKELVRLYG